MSNISSKDSTNKVIELIDHANKIGLKGIAITDHECLSSHVEASKYIEKQKKCGKIREDFNLGLGNEIYLVDREEVQTLRENNEKISFYHLILIAKNKNGHKALRELSSNAWENSFFYRGVERRPTYKDDFERVVKKYKNDLICTTACLGGELGRLSLEYLADPTPNKKIKIHKFITFMKDLLGRDFYIELQPSNNQDQITYNEFALTLAMAYGVKPVIATDSHYLNKNQSRAHEIYLKSTEAEREVAEFYSSTYLMTVEEIKSYFAYLPEETIDKLLLNTLDIDKEIETYSLANVTQIPRSPIPNFELGNIFKNWYGQCEYLAKYAESESIYDRYLLYRCEEGFLKKNQAFTEENIKRIDTELSELWQISAALKQSMSSYYLTVSHIIEIIWKTSIVAPSRGSAAGFYISYLTEIIQVSPIEHNLVHWRHLTATRPDFPDIDIDSQSSERKNIIRLIAEEYGEKNVLSIATFKREKSKSAIKTACRGLGLDTSIGDNMANLIPEDKSGMWTIQECLYGNEKENKKPVRELIKEFEKHPEILEVVLVIDNLISGRSSHAGGVIIYNNGYEEFNAMMKTPSGLRITQFNMGDSEYMGGIKYDLLSTNALDKIRKSLDLLLEDNVIEWQGSLKETYDKYLHPDVIEYEGDELFKCLNDGEVIDAFQYDTQVGVQVLKKIKPTNLMDISAGNNLMRLSPDEETGELPLDKFVKHKHNIDLWYQEMDEYGLLEEEIEILKSYIGRTYGVCDSQERLMLLTMEKNIANLDIEQSNHLRKGIGKKKKELIEECKITFYNNNPNCRKELLDYCWNVLFRPHFQYSFSELHSVPYSIILLQQMNICKRYGSIYWKAACLCANAGLIGEEAGTIDYGKIAKAVGDMKDIITPPDINISKMEFTPYAKENKILFGLKPIVGLDTKDINTIVENRPYTSIKDFVSRVIHPGLISEAKAVILVKCGAFDKLENKLRRDMMVNLINETIIPKTKLTMVQLPVIMGCVPKERFKSELDIYSLRTKLFGKKKVPMNSEIEQQFISKYANEIEFGFENGKLSIAQKAFDKVYEKKVVALKEWLNLEEALGHFNKYKKQQFWKKYCMGTKESWEMQTLVYYTDKHELDYMPLEEYVSVYNFFDLPIEPVILNYTKKGYPIFKTYMIAGTVVNKDKKKRLVHISTQYGVVGVKYSEGVFTNYDKKIIDIRENEKELLDPSWFDKGTRLIIQGYRRGEQFTAKAYEKNLYNHTTMKIFGQKEHLKIQTEKKRI